MRMSGNKIMFGVIALILILFAITIFFYSKALNDLASNSCTDAITCSHAKIVDTQNIIITALLIVIALIACWLLYLSYGEKAGEKITEKKEESVPISTNEPALVAPKKASASKIDTSSLDLDERKIIDFLRQKQGSVFQSEIQVRTGFSKVKVSRILDKLEQKGFLERKRRGMANLVVLK